VRGRDPIELDGRPEDGEYAMDEVRLTLPTSSRDAPGATPRTPPEDEPPAGPASWRRALGLLWLSQVISHLGDSLFLVGIFFLALQVTGSKAVSGLLVAMNFLPALALGLFAGAFVDRHDRRRIMIAADLLRALAVGMIPVLHATGHLRALPLAVAMFSLATGTTIFNPAIKALLPELTPPGRLAGAVSLFQISESVALVVGPAIAAVALPAIGMIHLFSLDCVTFLFSTLCLLSLPREARRRMHRPPASEPLRVLLPALIREVEAGVRAVGASPVLRVLFILAALDNLVVMGLAQVGTPLLVKETLGLGADAYARAQTAYFLGMASASAGVWLAGRKLPRGPTILVGVVLDGLTCVPLAFCQTLVQVQLALFVHAIAIPLIVIPRTVLIQHTVPGPLHGRTFALVNVMVFGMTAISAAAVGILSEQVAARTLFLLGPLAIVPGLAGFASRAVRATR
jgi:MFS transporter, DHA3 family, macrolide efflux protein